MAENLQRTINPARGRLQAHKLLPALWLPRIHHSLPHHQSTAFIHSQHNKKKKKIFLFFLESHTTWEENPGNNTGLNEAIAFGTIEATGRAAGSELQGAVPTLKESQLDSSAVVWPGANQWPFGSQTPPSGVMGWGHRRGPPHSTHPEVFKYRSRIP